MTGGRPERSRYVLRPVEPDDRELLFSIYASSRADELSVLPWTPAQKDAFLRQQFEAQDLHYRQHYQGASFLVIQADGRPAGRLYVARWEREIRVMEIALLPAHRGRGLGTAVLSELQAESEATGKRLTIHVERNNPALRLYERLGFKATADLGVYLFLERSPTAPAGSEGP